MPIWQYSLWKWLSYNSYLSNPAWEYIKTSIWLVFVLRVVGHACMIRMRLSNGKADRRRFGAANVEYWQTGTIISWCIASPPPYQIKNTWKGLGCIHAGISEVGILWTVFETVLNIWSSAESLFNWQNWMHRNIFKVTHITGKWTLIIRLVCTYKISRPRNLIFASPCLQLITLHRELCFIQIITWGASVCGQKDVLKRGNYTGWASADGSELRMFPLYSNYASVLKISNETTNLSRHRSKRIPTVTCSLRTAESCIRNCFKDTSLN